MAALSLGASKSSSSVLITALKITAVVLVIYYAAAFLYGLFFGVLAWPHLQALLNSGGLPSALNNLGIDAKQMAMLIVNLTAVPMGYALMAAIFPFIGAWIYLSEPDKKTTGIGLGVALSFTVFNICLNLALNPETLKAVSGPMGALGLAIGFLFASLYVFFFMGIGFNFAKIFKLKAKSDALDLSSL